MLSGLSYALVPVALFCQPGPFISVFLPRSFLFSNQSRSQSFVPLDQRLENESSSQELLELERASLSPAGRGQLCLRSHAPLLRHSRAGPRSFNSRQKYAFVRFFRRDVKKDMIIGANQIWRVHLSRPSCLSLSLSLSSDCPLELFELSFSDRWSRGTKLWDLSMFISNQDGCRGFPREEEVGTKSRHFC